MLYRDFRKTNLITAVLSFVLIGVFFVRVSQAVNIVDINTLCSPTSLEDPSPLQIVCPLFRVFNILIFSVGAVFTIMVIYGAIKLAMALGDPKAFEGARQTYVWAIIGLAVILGFFAILTILNGVFGLGIRLDLFQWLTDSLYNLLTSLGINNVIP